MPEGKEATLAALRGIIFKAKNFSELFSLGSGKIFLSRTNLVVYLSSLPRHLIKIMPWKVNKIISEIEMSLVLWNFVWILLLALTYVFAVFPIIHILPTWHKLLMANM